MKRKFVAVTSEESVSIIQPFLDSGWAVKLMSAAPYATGNTNNAYAPAIFVYLEKDE